LRLQLRYAQLLRSPDIFEDAIALMSIGGDISILVISLSQKEKVEKYSPDKEPFQDSTFMQGWDD
jgi:hypothetical protein